MHSPKTCPNCGAISHVTESRKISHGQRRRRQCAMCASRWTTLEFRIPEMVHNPKLGYKTFYDHLEQSIEEYAASGLHEKEASEAGKALRQVQLDRNKLEEV